MTALYLYRVDVKTAADDHVLLAAHDVDETILVHGHQLHDMAYAFHSSQSISRHSHIFFIFSTYIRRVGQ